MIRVRTPTDRSRVGFSGSRLKLIVTANHGQHVADGPLTGWNRTGAALR